jgi:hypothetical protein
MLASQYLSSGIFFVFHFLSTVHSKCFLEKGHVDESLWNETALLKCHDMRTENICIIGGGLSGIHMGWLLKRRGSPPASLSFFPHSPPPSGFQNTIVFERDLLPGGMIYTSENSDDLPRELSAAFLSPDSGEMTALVSRFDLSLLAIGLDAISYRQASHNTSSHEDLILTPVQWYEHALPLVTGENDSQTNSEIVFTALERYTLVHMEIFGTYLTRLPPRPASYAQLQMLKGTFLEFLQRHDLLALLPMMFQVFSVKVLSLTCLSPSLLFLFQWEACLRLS